MKKWLSMVMAVVMVLTCAVPVFGDQGSSQELEKAILKAKSVVNIPQDCTVFSSRAYDNTSEGKGAAYFVLEWENEKADKAISITVDRTGNFLEYHYYINEKDQPGLAKVSRNQAQKNAEAFLKKAVPEYAQRMKEVFAETNVTELMRHNFTYRYYLNDVPVSFMEANIAVDRYTGEVTGFYGFDPGFTPPQFPAVAGVISKAEADQAWLTELGLQLSYYSYYDYKAKQLQVFLAYTPKEKSGYVIDAKTGNTIKLKNDDVVYPGARSGMAKDASAENADGMGGLSPEEVANIQENASLISKEKAEQIIRTEFPILTVSHKLSGASLTQTVIDKGQYCWNLSFTDASASVDAADGSIVSFHYYGERKVSSSDIGETRAAASAAAFLQRTASDFLPETEQDEAYLLERSGEEAYLYQYNRMVNGCRFNSNYLTVGVDKANGLISSYNRVWYRSASFPGTDGLMKDTAAYQILDGSKTLHLAYDITEKGEAALVYEFNYPINDVKIDPKSGVFLGYNGKEETQRRIPSYTDIKGHWSEVYVTALLENGYFLSGTEFKPNQVITQLDFLRYLCSADGYTADADALYERLERNGIIEEEEKNPNGPLLRQDAAKFFVRSLSLQKAGEHPELFVNVFQDQVQYDYKGYATLCSGLGILKGDWAGRFNGTVPMTRAEAASAIYRMSMLK